MSASYTCDGCGIAVEKPKQIGHVIKRDYCDTCAPKAQGFVDAEEALRVAVQKEYLSKRNELIAQYVNFKLPDNA